MVYSRSEKQCPKLIEEGILSLAKEARSDVAHICLLQFVILATHPIDADVLERGDDSFDIESHGDEAVDQLLVVALVPVNC